MGGCGSKPIDWDEEVCLGHFSLGNAIGKGGFTRVKLVEYRKTQETYALKFMDKKAIVGRKSAKNYIQERKILEELDHPYITNLRWAFQDDKYLYYVLDLMMGGDLRFHHDRKWCPGEPAIRLWMAQIACAIGYLHSKRIVHRDLKIDNVLLDLEGHAHITDFNCATWINPGHHHFQVTGTRRYMAPEMIAHEGYGWEIDYWALGAMAYEMIFMDVPFGAKAKGEESIFRAITTDELVFPPNADKLCSKEGQDFIRGLLQKDPSSRLGCRSLRRGRQDIRNHPWFADIDWDKLEARQIPSLFKPDSSKLNFNISHELDEFMVVDKPLTQGRRRKKDRDVEKLDKQERDLEEQFAVFDHTRSVRQSHHPYNRIVDSEPSRRAVPSTAAVSLPASLTPSRSPSRPSTADPSGRPYSTNPMLSIQLPEAARTRPHRPVTIGSAPIGITSLSGGGRRSPSLEAGTNLTPPSTASSLTCVTSRDEGS